MYSGRDQQLPHILSLLEEPDKNVCAQDLVAGSYTLCGWLRKRGTLNILPGTKKVFPWSHRFLVLHIGCLYYYKSETAKKPAGAFSLYGYNTVFRAGEVLPAEAPWAFKICHTYEEYKTYYFSASSEQEMKEWMKQIRLEMLRANNKQKQRTKADGQEDEIDQKSLTYEDIEKEIYDDPSKLVIAPGAPQAKRADEVSDDEGDEAFVIEDYVDSDVWLAPSDYDEGASPPIVPNTKPRYPPTNSPAPIPPRDKKPGAKPMDSDIFPGHDGQGVRKVESDRETPKSAIGHHERVQAVTRQLNDLLKVGMKPIPPTKPAKTQPMKIRVDQNQVSKKDSTEILSPVIEGSNETVPSKKDSVDIESPVKDSTEIGSPEKEFDGIRKKNFSRIRSPKKDSTEVKLGDRGDGDSQKTESRDIKHRQPVLLPVSKQKQHRSRSPTIPDEFAPSLPQFSTTTEQPASEDEDVDSDIYWSQVFFKESTDSTNASEVIRNIGEEGVYLVRGESSGTGQVLVVFASNIPKKYRISQEDGKVYLKPDEKFDSIADLLLHYHSSNLPCNVKLKMAYFKHPSFKEK